MLQHPLESLDNTTTCQESRDDSLDSFSPFIVDDDDDVDLSSFEKRVSPPPPAIHNNDNIVRAQSPFGRRYLKPINGIQIKGFARSAQRRSSVLTLGSIERLQNFYAKKELKVNKIGTLGFQQETFVEEPDSIEDQLPTPQEPPPSWIDLNVETDLDILLSLCFKDIQTTLTIITLTEPLDTTLHPDTSFQILPFLQAVTTMLSSVKKYTVNRQDLSNEAINKLRYASLHLLEIIKELETNYRLKEEEEEEEKGDTKGFLYRASDFNRLGKERQAIHDYLNVIEKYAFNPPHHIGSPPALFTPEIETLIEKMGILSLTKEEEIKTFNNIPEWLERGSFVNNPIGRYYALILDNNQDQNIPNPDDNKEAFLRSLSDGIVFCNVYNSIVKRSLRPFGLITKIHSDNKRTYRAIENLRFFATACKFRFELVFDEFDPSEIAKKTDKGLHMIDNALSKFCDYVIRELREQVDTTIQKLLIQQKK